MGKGPKDNNKNGFEREDTVRVDLAADTRNITPIPDEHEAITQPRIDPVPDEEEGFLTIHAEEKQVTVPEKVTPAKEIIGPMCEVNRDLEHLFDADFVDVVEGGKLFEAKDPLKIQSDHNIDDLFADEDDPDLDAVIEGMSLVEGLFDDE